MTQLLGAGEFYFNVDAERRDAAQNGTQEFNKVGLEVWLDW